MEIPAGTAGGNFNAVAGSAAATATLTQLPAALLRPQVIEAVVVSASLLPAIGNGGEPATQSGTLLTGNLLTGALLSGSATAPTPAPASNSAAASLPLLLPGTTSQTARQADLSSLFRIALQWQGKRFEVASPQRLQPGATARIQVAADNTLWLRAEIPPATGPASTAAPAPTAAPTAPGRQATLPPMIEAALQAVQPLVRENLPRQQPLDTLLPLLRTLLAPAREAELPPTLTRALSDLWRNLPTPDQLRQPAALRAAMRHSGSFLEADVARARAGAPRDPQALPRTLGADLKAQITLLLTLLRSLPRSAAPTAGVPQSATGQPQPGTPPQTETAAHAAAPRGDGVPPPRPDVGTDQLLQQLGKALEGGLSRIQLNQLDAVLSRHQGGDTTQPVPTWVLELPVRTQQGRDHIGVRIEQHARRRAEHSEKVWIVQLGFDLHELGRLAATLSIAGHSVAATLWADRERTHRTVQREMASLREGLEAAGVRVTEMQCRLGNPPPRTALQSRRLVDTHS